MNISNFKIPDLFNVDSYICKSIVEVTSSNRGHPLHQYFTYYNLVMDKNVKHAVKRKYTLVEASIIITIFGSPKETVSDLQLLNIVE